MKDLVFKSLGQAYNYLKDQKRKLTKVKKEKHGAREEFGVREGGKSNYQRTKYLKYCVSLLKDLNYNAGQKEFHVLLLTAMINGYSREYIARTSGCDMKTFELHEKEAMNRVQDAIHQTKKRKFPLFKEEMPRIQGVRH